MSVGPGDGHAHGSGNPHYWLDPRNAEIITANILETLARIDPANAATYEANRQAFLARLNAKLSEWETKLSALKTMPFVAYHNSWPYFARRFRLDIAGFIETKPGVPPSPAHLAGIPPMTKGDLMQHWDAIVTDERCTLAAAETHLAQLTGDAYFLDELHLIASGGSSGTRRVCRKVFDDWTAFGRLDLIGDCIICT